MCRRVLCLMLVFQLLLTQGLLSRCCTMPCGHDERATARTPHIHMTSLNFATGSAKTGKCRCGCCVQQKKSVQREADRVEHWMTESGPANATDDILYVGEMAATRDRVLVMANWVTTSIHWLSNGCNLLSSIPFVEVTQVLCIPLSSRQDKCPLFLQTLTLLI